MCVGFEFSYGDSVRRLIGRIAIIEMMPPVLRALIRFVPVRHLGRLNNLAVCHAPLAIH